MADSGRITQPHPTVDAEPCCHQRCGTRHQRHRPGHATAYPRPALVDIRSPVLSPATRGRTGRCPVRSGVPGHASSVRNPPRCHGYCQPKRARPAAPVSPSPPRMEHHDHSYRPRMGGHQLPAVWRTANRRTLRRLPRRRPAGGGVPDRRTPRRGHPLVDHGRRPVHRHPGPPGRDHRTDAPHAVAPGRAEGQLAVLGRVC
jgi:hypothetical protein